MTFFKYDFDKSPIPLSLDGEVIADIEVCSSTVTSCVTFRDNSIVAGDSFIPAFADNFHITSITVNKLSSHTTIEEIPPKYRLKETTVISGDSISVRVLQDIEVTGIITSRGNHDICVEITKPYNNLTAWGPHIPHFVPRNYHFFTGYYGDYWAEKLLIQLYAAGNRLHRSLKKIKLLRSEYIKIQEEIRLEKDKQDVNKAIFLKERADLRKLLKTGELVPKEYQKKLQTLVDSHKTSNDEITHN